jgi:hypothetical protein
VLQTLERFMPRLLSIEFVPCGLADLVEFRRRHHA